METVVKPAQEGIAGVPERWMDARDGLRGSKRWLTGRGMGNIVTATALEAEHASVRS